MDTRTLGYIGLGVLIGIVAATLIGVPPFIWITAAIVAIAITAAVVMAHAAGTSDAARMLPRENPERMRQPEPVAAAPEVPTPQRSRISDVELELVRPAGDDGSPAVWLHRRGGRRVHRFETGSGWVVERVSTKDPDNPKKRIIGESLSFASEADAIVAADELAQGQTPTSPFPERHALAVAKA
jgi:hypothetical protein